MRMTLAFTETSVTLAYEIARLFFKTAFEKLPTVHDSDNNCLLCI